MAFLPGETGGPIPGSLYITFEDHVTNQHAKTIIDMVGGQLVELTFLEILPPHFAASITVLPDRTPIVLELLNGDENVKSAEQPQSPELMESTAEEKEEENWPNKAALGGGSLDDWE